VIKPVATDNTPSSVATARSDRIDMLSKLRRAIGTKPQETLLYGEADNKPAEMC